MSVVLLLLFPIATPLLFMLQWQVRTLGCEAHRSPTLGCECRFGGSDRGAQTPEWSVSAWAGPSSPATHAAPHRAVKEEGDSRLARQVSPSSPQRGTETTASHRHIQHPTCSPTAGFFFFFLLGVGENDILGAVPSGAQPAGQDQASGSASCRSAGALFQNHFRVKSAEEGQVPAWPQTAEHGQRS